MKGENENRGLKAFISSEYRNLVSFVKRYLNERYYNISAEDVVQDVALNLFSKLDFDEQLENVAGYVYRSIKNKITDFQRKNKKEILFEKFSNEEGEESYSHNIPEIEESFELEIDDSRFYEQINDALSQLSPNQQMIFIATEMEGYTFEEVAEELDIPIGTLLSWKHRGVKKMKEIIKLDELYMRNDN
ncbi:MAG: RNA polymerase sigma factor [Bacteroidetes bacterium]|nr:RNA polymerase sigma factor [Bacteroidota bacterium]